ncbi:hypothetical protein K3K35_002690 [Vibrio parahaemolyticus]|uniref:hypothetical protein n=1 Tax=Vibrio parahaemolyticus TaxID=670 RepID=UPI0004D5FC03|nr:hypothetical protein [Vibrio parahaemolyticus]EGQ7877684.1 hypothetical protein [Vibrio parahaemolyticus]EGR0229198.1 hypothetical protein [Vibrio parahaemolyticus]EGR1364185.1 hypothetical protein [Vibrio parahaemolyticus]EGR9059805.1 hypothetical protein [Vibrio parahaemolyticus]EGU1087630.1 hypothetical protein [Vibrio parahaemolyticus]
MSKWYHDKDKLKDVFDGITNYILCGVVCYIGVHAIFQKTEMWFLNYAYNFSGVIFILASVYLFYANTSYLKHKVIKLYDFDGWKFHVANTLFSFVLIFGIAVLFNEALKIPVGNVPLGDTKIVELFSE